MASHYSDHWKEVWETATHNDELDGLRGGIIRIWDGGLRALYFTHAAIFDDLHDTNLFKIVNLCKGVSPFDDEVLETNIQGIDYEIHEDVSDYDNIGLARAYEMGGPGGGAFSTAYKEAFFIVILHDNGTDESTYELVAEMAAELANNLGLEPSPLRR